MKRACSTALATLAWACAISIAPAWADVCRPGSAEAAPPDSNFVAGSNELPLSVESGEIAFKGDNALLPKFKKSCATHVTGAFASDRFRVDVVAAERKRPAIAGAERGSDRAVPWFADMAVDLLSDGAAAWSLGTSFAARETDEPGTLNRYFGARNDFGLFDDRLRATIDVGVSLAGEDGRKDVSTKYRLAGDIWRDDDFSVTGFAGFGLTGPYFADDGVDVTADRQVQEFGLSFGAGRFDLDLEYELKTDNTAGDDAVATRRWDVWNAELGIDLSGLYRLLPDELKFEIEQEQLGYADGGGGADLDELSREYDLKLTWPDRGGKTFLKLSTSSLDDRSAGDSTGDETSYGLTLGRDLDSGPWNLEAEAGIARESEFVDGRERWFNSYDLELDLTYRPGPFEELGFEAEIELADDPDRGPMSLDDAKAMFKYELRF